MPQDIVDAVRVGSKAVVVADCDLRGDITLGAGTILQPGCTLLAVAGPIVVGENNIVEDNVVIVNRHRAPMVIGDNNLFEVGCRIESLSIGNYNSFGIRSRVVPAIRIGNHCAVGAGCLVQPDPFKFVAGPVPETAPSAERQDSAEEVNPGESTLNAATAAEAAAGKEGASAAPKPAALSPAETLPDFTHIFGSENRRRIASQEGLGQARALYAKHWEYLRDTLPRFHQLRMF